MTREADLQIKDWSRIFSDWLFETALPLWWEKGADRARGGFFEALELDGSACAMARRARVQARQSFVFSLAGKLGWQGPWETAAKHGLYYLQARFRRPDGLFRTLVSPDGAGLDDTAMTYDQAFALLAAASLYDMQPGGADAKYFALHVLSRLQATRQHQAGGFSEEGAIPFLSNPQMHPLEAALAWIDADGDRVWDLLADDIAALCLRNLADPEKLVVREYFDASWAPQSGRPGNCIEPGHQFEWAWLLARWSRLRGREDALSMSRALFAAGIRGVDAVRNVAVDEIGADGTVRRSTARLWPQTERLKAALLLARYSEGSVHSEYQNHACKAAESLWGYLQAPLPGLWRDRMLADGSYGEEPAPASSLYHINMCRLVPERRL